MIVEIEDDFADDIVIASLAQSYVSISKDVKNINNWHEDDIAAWKEVLPALKIVLKWYCVDFDAEIKKVKSRK
jgi:hypothetical protein